MPEVMGDLGCAIGKMGFKGFPAGGGIHRNKVVADGELNHQPGRTVIALNEDIISRVGGQADPRPHRSENICNVWQIRRYLTPDTTEFFRKGNDVLNTQVLTGAKSLLFRQVVVKQQQQ